MTSVAKRYVGEVGLADLKVISDFYGREFLPYPFWITEPRRFATRDEYVAHASSIVSRFQEGDLSIFREWAGTYVDADIRVECHVKYPQRTHQPVRLMAHRMGDRGFFSAQRPTEDTVDVFSLSPYDLGAVIAESVPTGKPGTMPSVAIAEYRPARSRIENDDVVVSHSIDDDTPIPMLSRSSVMALGTVQSHWRPARRWGLDRSKTGVAWVEIQDLGVYIYDRDLLVARPMTKDILRERVDRLISEDVAILRELRQRR